MRTLLVTFGLILCTIVVFAGDQRKAKTHTVTIEGMRFQPEVLTVDRRHHRGSTRTWFLTPRRRRLQLRFEVDSGRQVLEIHHPEKGDFAYICTFHPTMKAMLRVE